MKILSCFFCFGILLLSSCAGVSEKNFSPDEVNVIPLPKEMKINAGSFRFTDDTKFVVENEDQKAIVELLKSRFQKAAGFALETTKDTPKQNFVSLNTDPDLGPEAYRLKVDEGKAVIQAASASGFVYGLETLRQLLPKEIESEEKIEDVVWQVPQIEINDAPEFRWRGLMLDVSRHFFEKEYVLNVIDRLALLKMNTLQLHLVDDQGWRLEIKEYPKLTEVGAFRVDQENKPWNARQTPEKGQETTYGGFYTQEEIREIVAYAQKRGINVVPEIEMPAHVMSAIAAYPELSCTGEESMVPSGGVWPITTIYCPGKESTFEFLENVMLEVMELFPSKYIHVGGDEATKTNWETCPDCQRRIAEEGLSGVEELQSYFIKRMEKYLSSHGRTLIGWDEILEGGLAPGATVMSWRGTQGGWEASKEGHDVVMTPTSHMYLDYYQGNPDSEPLAFGGYTPLNKVYDFRPVIDSMSVAQKKHVLGGQANLWSEFIPTNSHSEYMMFPRLVALSEVLWTSEEKLDWNDFAERLQNFLPRLETMNINYATSAFDVNAQTEADLENRNIQVNLQTEFPDSEIRFALGEEKLTASSKNYTNPISLSETTTLKAAVFKGKEVQGDTLVKGYIFHKSVAKQVELQPLYDSRYSGKGKSTLVNVIRGSKNFHDGQWLGWLGEDVEIDIDLQEPTEIRKIRIGTLENQGAGIYYPVKISAFVSDNGKDFISIGKIERDFQNNPLAELKDFEISTESLEARYLKLKIKTYDEFEGNGRAWLFLDEVIVE